MRMRTQGGFTVIELLVSMALLTGLGALLLQLVRGSFDLYEKGDQRGELYATAVPVLQLLEDDLTAIHGGPEGRLLLIAQTGPGGSEGLLLRLLRTAPGGERHHPVLRPAGTRPDANASYTGSDPGPKDRGQLAPPSGLVEVAYALLQEERDPQGVLTLYRGTRAPALEGDTFFKEDVDGLDTAWVRKNLAPVSTGILGLWILCEAQSTEDWGEEDVMEGKGASHLAFRNWDSTRGMLDREQFPLAVGPASRDDPRDDVFPRRVRVIMQVARGLKPEAVLRRSLIPESQALDLNTTKLFPPTDDGNLYAKVGGEFMRIERHEGSSAVVTRHRRGTSSKATVHRAGTQVFLGRTFRKTLRIPASRSYWTEGNL